MSRPKWGAWLYTPQQMIPAPANSDHPNRIDGDLLYLQRLIVRWRYLFFTLVGFVLVLSFNGQWQVGPDSADYRELGHQLAEKNHYFFRDSLSDTSGYIDQQDTRYPGLPVYLALVEKCFGRSPLPPLIGMMAAAIACLALAYRVLRFCLPQWLGVCVVVGMGTNGRFLQYANELLTDIPFLLGLLLTLLGYEMFLRARGGWRMGAMAAVLLGGMTLAATMRPTFWILAAALLIACAMALLMAWRRRRALGPAFGKIDTCAPVPRPAAWRYAVICLVMVLAALLFVLWLDLRHRSMLHGGYEAKVVAGLRDFNHKIVGLLPVHTVDLLEDSVPNGFFGIRFGNGIPVVHEPPTRAGIPGRIRTLGLGAIISMLVIISGVRLMRYNAFWGWLVLVSAVALLILGPVTRYIVMILPLLLAGWGMLFSDLAGAIARRKSWAKATLWANSTLCVGLAVVLGPNLVRAADFIRTQRGYTKPFTPPGKWQGINHLGFLQVYHDGKWAALYTLADMLREHTAMSDKIVGPEASVLTFLSGRQVYQPGIVVPRKGKQSQGVSMAFFPAPPANAEGDWVSPYYEYDRELSGLMRQGFFIRRGHIAGPSADYTLDGLYVLASRQPRGQVPPTTQHVPHSPRPTTARSSTTARTPRGDAPATPPPPVRTGRIPASAP